MRTPQEIENRAWDIAIGHYLSDFPDDKTAREIIDLVEQDSPEVTIWEPFEFSDPDWMSSQIWIMKTYIETELRWAAGIDDDEDEQVDYGNPFAREGN